LIGLAVKDAGYGKRPLGDLSSIKLIAPAGCSDHARCRAIVRKSPACF
jgi:hypothetical protein